MLFSSSFVRSFRALIWRNIIYKKRRPFSSLADILLPVVSIYLLAHMKGYVENFDFFQPQVIPAYIPTDKDVLTPLSFGDYVTGMNAKKQCVIASSSFGSYGGNSQMIGAGGFGGNKQITGGIGGNWANPFVRCNVNKCKTNGASAEEFCEIRILALAPSTTTTTTTTKDNKKDVHRFRDWILEQHPLLNPDFVKVFDSDSDIETYVGSEAYGMDLDHPKVAGAIVLEKGSSPEYSYTIRANSTNYNGQTPSMDLFGMGDTMATPEPMYMTHPITMKKFDPHARDPKLICPSADVLSGALSNLDGSVNWAEYCTGQYVNNGVLTLQRLVDDWIISEHTTTTTTETTSTKSTTTKVEENGVSFLSFPRESYTRSGFYKYVGEFVPILVILGFTYPLGNMLRLLVEEKELRQKELMKMLSITDFCLESSWFVTFLFFSGLPCVYLISHYTELLYDKTSFSLLLVFWTLVYCVLIMYSFAFSTLFSKSSRAALVGQMFFYGGYFRLIKVDISGGERPSLLYSLHPCTGIVFGMQLMGFYEEKDFGVTWDNLDYSDFDANGYSFRECLDNIVMSIWFWGVFAWYCNRALPQEYGVPLPPFFPFMKSYWLTGVVGGDKTSNNEEHSSLAHQDNIVSNPLSCKVEPIPESLKDQIREGSCIQIQSLTKEFGGSGGGFFGWFNKQSKENVRKVAVNSLSLQMFKGHITALLGKNGAGKTTTINMLTGMLPPTSGDAYINGKSIRSHMDSTIRGNMGICLQHDCLFPLLTVKEHLLFFSQIKNSNNTNTDEEEEDINKMVDQSMKDVALFDKADTLSKNLSGGMKRKLSVAIAFCGKSSVVFLDEPTSGMDPFSRRFTWNVIREYRQNRCIILTTHFMDEADLLGDRIAIMSEGVLRCVGSSLFLKKTYGVGYQLTIEKLPSSTITELNANDGEEEEEEREDSVKAELESILSIYIPEAKLLSNAGSEISFQLSLTTTTSNKSNKMIKSGETSSRNSSEDFVGLFKELDTMVDHDQIITYGVSITTLDEVFLMVARGDDLDAINNKKKKSYLSQDCEVGSEEEEEEISYDADLDELVLFDEDDSSANLESGPTTKKQNKDMKKKKKKKHQTHFYADPNALKGGISTFNRHIKALVRKRYFNFKRDKRQWFFSIILPCLFTFMGFLVLNKNEALEDMPPLNLSLDDYNVVDQYTGKGGKNTHHTIFSKSGGKGDNTLDRNPIVFNKGSTFQCEFKNSCVMKESTIEEATTNETYFFCRQSATLDSNKKEQCSLDTDFNSNVMNQVTQLYNNYGDDDGVFLVPDELSTDIPGAAIHLLESAKKLDSVQYGAIYFTHDPTSTISNSSTSYNKTVVEKCMKKPGDYRTREECLNYGGGLSYIVATNYTSIHAPILYQKMADEAIINEFLSSSSSTKKAEKVSINATVHPLPRTASEWDKIEDAKGFFAWFLIIFSFPFVTSSFGTFIVTERQSKAKHLQTVAGVSPSAYWFSSLIWDTINYQIPFWAVMAMMYGFGIDTFTTHKRDAASGTFCVMFLFGPAAAGFTYVISYLFESPSKVNFSLVSLNLFVGLAGPLLLFILEMFASMLKQLDSFGGMMEITATIPGGDGQEQWNDVTQLTHIPDLTKFEAKVLFVLRLFPCFNLGKALFYIVNAEVIEGLKGFGMRRFNVWSPQILLHEFYALSAQCILYPLLAILLDQWSTNPKVQKLWEFFLDIVTLKLARNFLQRRGYLRSSSSDGTTTTGGGEYEPVNSSLSLSMDEDVAAEESRVLSGETDNDLIVIDKLTKRYRQGNVLAVDNLCLAIPPGECFGLLGINGAGKTTTIAILTAEFSPSSGDATLSGFSVVNQPSETRQRIGYCPQFNAHFENMTGREHIELYASIRGIPPDQIKEAARAKLKQVGLSETDSDKLSSNYSGGMKRKLSVACALIGEPEIVFLDEPSTGMDPVARRELWAVISKMVQRKVRVSSSSGNGDDDFRLQQTSVILTTHSMEECEALCPRIGIMAGGRLKCLGSAQLLKLRYGKGYQVELKIADGERHDDDYRNILRTLYNSTTAAATHQEDATLIRIAESTLLNLENAKSAVESLTNDNSISSMICSTNPNGYVIYKNATENEGGSRSGGGGVSLDELCAFCVQEMRMKNAVEIMKLAFPQGSVILRERQENKGRFEVNQDGLRVSELFQFVENNKERLHLSDYGISQTSLEQVFNMHAQGHFQDATNGGGLALDVVTATAAAAVGDDDDDDGSKKIV